MCSKAYLKVALVCLGLSCVDGLCLCRIEGGGVAEVVGIRGDDSKMLVRKGRRGLMYKLAMPAARSAVSIVWSSRNGSWTNVWVGTCFAEAGAGLASAFDRDDVALGPVSVDEEARVGVMLSDSLGSTECRFR